jgi:hypothetical protein
MEDYINKKRTTKCVSVKTIIGMTNFTTSVVCLESMVLRMLQAWLITACTPFSTEASRDVVS